MELNAEYENVESLPHDLVSEILARLPVKSLRRFSSVSTRWYNTIYSDPLFFKSHFSFSQSKSQTDHLTLLFTFPDRNNMGRLIFSATIPTQIQTQSPSPQSTAVHHLTVPGFDGYVISKSLQGLIGFESHRISICNPTTRQIITLPRAPHSSTETLGSCYNSSIFGFDPVKNEHKVLNTWTTYAEDSRKPMIMENRVFTVESDRVWRRIDDGPPHRPAWRESVCINGLVYYLTCTGMDHPEHHIIMSFDVYEEKFHIIELPVDFTFHLDYDLIECDGRLGLVDYQGIVEGNNLDIWVLEDEGNSRWGNKRIVVFPDNWSDLKGKRKIQLGGTTCTGEMIFGPRSLEKPFYVFFYDIKCNSLRRVEICGLPDYKINLALNFMNVISVTDHVESILTLAEPDFEEGDS